MRNNFLTSEKTICHQWQKPTDLALAAGRYYSYSKKILLLQQEDLTLTTGGHTHWKLMDSQQAYHAIIPALIRVKC